MSETLVRMPRLADTLVEGTLGQWLKHVGEPVARGERLASIETDKVTTELTSPAAGTLLELMVQEGQTVPVETPIARIGDASAAPPAAEETSSATPEPSPVSPEPPPVPLERPPVPPEPRPARKATPVAARLLAEHGLRPEQVAPSGPPRLRKQDVLAFIARQPAPQASATPISTMRRAIAEHMLKAHQTIPRGQTVMDADLTHLVAWREEHKAAFQQQHGAPLTFTILFVKALAGQLADHLGEHVDIGVAVALDNGLIVPVLRRADTLDIVAAARGVADLAARARANKLAPDDTHGAQMTITNVGSFGNLTASPIIPIGQIGILGPGVVERRPLPAPGGGIRTGWRCLLTLMFDRRAFDDLGADQFLRGVVERLAAIPEVSPTAPAR
jgi:pyruvate/2-oxoglutarate dehydrogenase complex dihydrolipoamide acyltransferase (E2) component